MARVIESEKFDLEVVESQNSKGESRYIVRYGLQTRFCNTLQDAIIEFQSCLTHALESNGIYIQH